MWRYVSYYMTRWKAQTHFAMQLLVILSVYNRLETLRSTYDWYKNITCVAEVRVVWHNPEERVPEWLSPFTPTTNSLNNRFAPEAAAGYNVALHVDDDVLLPEDVVCNTFSLWQVMQTTVFIFDPRFLDFQKSFYRWNQVCDINVYNTGFVTKGSIFATAYLSEYFAPKWKTARHSITEYVTGEDLLMSAVLASKPLVAVYVGDFRKVKNTVVPLASRTSRHRRLVMTIIGRALNTTLQNRTRVFHGSPLKLDFIGPRCRVY